MELISAIADIVFLIAFIFYVKHNQIRWNISAKAFLDLQKRVSELEAKPIKNKGNEN